jgi:hypothetical protein
VVVVCDAGLVCWVTVVVVGLVGFVVLVVLSEKHDDSNRASNKLQMPNMNVIFMWERYVRKSPQASGVNY